MVDEKNQLNTPMKMRYLINLVETAQGGTYLYHATPRSNLPSIMEHGLLVSKYGEVHDRMDYAPPVPCVYLSREHNSNNLHTDLTSQDYVVLMIDMAQMDHHAFYPDDAMGYAFADEMVLEDADEIAEALGVDQTQAEDMFDTLANSSDGDLIANLKPFWLYWLRHERGGEVAYAKNIPPSAIISYQ